MHDLTPQLARMIHAVLLVIVLAAGVCACNRTRYQCVGPEQRCPRVSWEYCGTAWFSCVGCFDKMDRASEQSTWPQCWDTQENRQASEEYCDECRETACAEIPYTTEVICTSVPRDECELTICRYDPRG
jgi:hypothetical protein